MPLTGTVLVAEDSGVIRAVVRDVLTPAGHTVVEAGDGMAALEVLCTQPVDVVLCDVEMPRLSGWGVLEAMRGNAGLATVPVVFLTGSTRSDQVAEGLRRGAYDYLRKPVEEIELLARIAAAVRTKRLQDDLRDRNAELERLATTDVLTGVANRRRLQAALADGADAAVMVDIDHFKAVNDTHGHDAGDAVLAAVAGRLRDAAGPDALVGRWGGEEFLVLGGDAPAVARAVHEAVRAERIGDLRVTVSAGWARGEDAVRRADDALYVAKAMGRDRVVAAESLAVAG